MFIEVIEVSTGKRKAVIIREAEPGDFKILTKKRYSFNWKSIRNSTTIYKLQMEGQDGILGVVGLVDWREEKIEIRLLVSSAENIGKRKIYEGIAGCLIAFACRLAVSKYGYEACVSLVPKTELIPHYMEMYYMENAGRQLYLDGNNMIRILKEYL